MLTAAGHWSIKDNLAFPVIDPQDRCLLRDNDLTAPVRACVSCFSPQHVRNTYVLSAVNRARGFRRLSRACAEWNFPASSSSTDV